MATASSKKLLRVQPKTYTTCLLYNTDKAKEKLKGISLAACNPKFEKKLMAVEPAVEKDEDPADSIPVDLTQLSVSNKMSCNYCDVTFENRLEQKRHYRSDWHRYNLKLRIHGKTGVSEEQFEIISGNISSLSGSDTEDDIASDIETGNDNVTTRRLTNAAFKLDQSINSSTDSESETNNQMEEAARRLPKVYFKNEAGELLSLYRCVISHKKNQPSTTDDLITMTTKLPDEMNWAIFMAGGGHFAGAVFSKDKLIVHKTFHRYVVRAKRGTAQSSRDSQGNAPKSGGASLRRYNEAALTEEIQALIVSWKDQLQTCDRIFLRAPSFNRKIFFGGKTPPFNKDDLRIRLIPFQTRRPTFNEVRRVFEMLASIECYGDETDIQDFIPISPPQVFNRDTRQLETKDESQLSPKHRKILNKKLRASPLVGDNSAGLNRREEKSEERMKERKMSPLPGHVRDEDNQSSGTSTASETEIVENVQEINTMDLKEFAATKKPKRKKKSGRKKGGLQKCQTEPESNVMEEEKYHLKNSLYTACKVGDLDSLRSLLAVFLPNVNHPVINGEAFYGKTGEGAKNLQQDVVNGLKCDPNTNNSDTSSKEDILETNTDKRPLQYNEDADTSMGNKSADKCDNLHKFTESVEGSRETSIEVKQQALIVRNSHISCESTSNCDSSSSNVFENVHSIRGSANDTIESDETSNSGFIQRDSQCDDDKTSVCDSNLQSIATKSANPHENHSCRTQNEESSVIDDNQVPTELQLSEVNQTKLLKKVAESGSMSHLKDLSPVVTVSILNEPFGDHDTTLLHVAAREGHHDVINLLMESGATPSSKDIFGQTPYMVSKDKSTRNEFRKFMGKWPEKYDYTQSQIPAPLSEEREAEKKKKDAERKKIKQKEKKEKMRAKKEEEDRKNAEEKERQRYLNLSDREKRALAAERRLVQQVTTQGGDTPVLSRCFQCATDMTGKVPFEYNDNKFCSPKCLQLHRKTKTTK